MRRRSFQGLRSGSLWTATFLHASHNLFIQAIFTPLTGNTRPTPDAIDEFGFVLPLVIAAAPAIAAHQKKNSTADIQHSMAGHRW